MDTDGLITAWNPAAEATFGWTREEAIGRMVSQTIIPPQFREAHEEGMKRYLRSGETTSSTAASRCRPSTATGTSSRSR